jgi:hypothetical protein
MNAIRLWIHRVVPGQTTTARTAAKRKRDASEVVAAAARLKRKALSHATHDASFRECG